ncbi:DUF2789 family protein [Nocardia sp. SYP-A9097]|uniref:DUF2789 family protein n=1 Tax=Nocardia sp. SYP-A9097 TaxID=2663237 RepID=UPI00129AEEAF
MRPTIGLERPRRLGAASRISRRRYPRAQATQPELATGDYVCATETSAIAALRADRTSQRGRRTPRHTAVQQHSLPLTRVSWHPHEIAERIDALGTKFGVWTPRRTGQYSLQDLFEMLGLPSGFEDIDQFVTRHSILKRSIRLSEAHFWTPQQREFFWELYEDGHYERALDELDDLLRRT